MTTTRAGFSLVEVVISMLILSVGVLAMGGATGYILSEVRLAGFTTDRNVAVRNAIEQLQSTDWSSLEARCSGAAFQAAGYTVTCSVEQPAVHLKKVALVSVGRSYQGGVVVDGVSETMSIVLAEPMP